MRTSIHTVCLQTKTNLHQSCKLLAATFMSNTFQITIRDWSLITGRGGLQNGRGGEGASEVLPLQKGGGKSFSHAEGVAQKVLG